MTNLEWIKELLKCIHLLIGTPVQQVQQILAVGQLLCQAKRASRGQRGQFGKIVADVPMEMRYAQMFMSIRNNPVLANANNHSLLPPAINTLYWLSTHPRCMELEEALANGRLHAKLTLDEVKAVFAQAVSDPTWSPDDAVVRIHNAYALAFNAELDRAPIDGRDQLIAAALDALPQLADHIQAGWDHDLRDDVQAAQDELAIRDAEPGGYRLYVDGQCRGGVKSTYPEFAKTLLTAGEGVTPLRRAQLDRSLRNLELGKLPTISTARNHTAVRLAIKGQGRRRWR